MDINDLLPVIFAVIGALVAFYAVSNSAKRLTNRLRIEKKLAYNLGMALKARNIDSEISIELNKLTVCSSCEEENLEQFKRHIDNALDEALEDLLISEQRLVKLSLDQPSLRGQKHYIKKLVSNSLNQLQHE